MYSELIAGLAQLVERPIYTGRVADSSSASRTKFSYVKIYANLFLLPL